MTLQERERREKQRIIQACQQLQDVALARGSQEDVAAKARKVESFARRLRKMRNTQHIASAIDNSPIADVHERDDLFAV